MAIDFAPQGRIFTLHTKNTTYQFQADRFGVLLHLYYGARTAGRMDYLLTYADRGFSGNPNEAGEDRTYSLDVLPQEYPCYGTGDYRTPALLVTNADGSFACEPRYVRHQIDSGKYALPGLPAVFAGAEEAQTLTVWLKDPWSGVEIKLLYGVLPELDIITRAAVITNGGDGPIHIRKAASATLDIPWGDFDLITLDGRYGMEREVNRRPAAQGTTGIASRRGYSSHQSNPLLILAEHTATEDAGKCYCMSFVYSGSFKGEAERDHLGLTRLQLGLQDENFDYPLAPGEALTAPEVILSFTNQGLTRLSHNLHDCLRLHLCRGRYADAPRPILVNSWESCYFDFDGETLCRLAADAKDLGLDMLVLDDGWFGTRHNDRASLGDWQVNEEKLGMSLGALIRRVNGLGVKFGLWIEPEGISEDSDLYRAHPDWAMTIPGRPPERSRSQLVLDFSRKEVVDGIFRQICAVLDQGNIEYVKWDCNRSLGNLFSRNTRAQGRVLYDYMLGVYDFMERLIRRYPHMLLETCSGGGGRFDAGMLYYGPQIWCSDNTDAIDRLRIQYGTSFGYPLSAMGSHVSAVPNHQTGRSVTLRTRSVTAMAGTFGYELNLGLLTEDGKDRVREQTALFRRYEALIRTGRYYRLTDPYVQDLAVWAVVARDRGQVLLSAVTQQTHGSVPVPYVRLKGLEPGAMYRDEATGLVYPADALMDMGLPMPVAKMEHAAAQLFLQMI